MQPAQPSAAPCLPGRHLVTLEVDGRPASFATAAEAPWKAAVRAAVAKCGIAVADARFAVAIDFRTPVPKSRNEVWDIDNLVKPTLDALEGVFGFRKWKGVPQPADDRVDHLAASKRTVAVADHVGATIVIHTL
ncbi:RusA family crossover junction endodeoxyribonuclease [Geodermatophilus sp. URMC 61]|uniref:RusA family crossover junction endodeoxyribonuclease n=1 Tax=Geodermatophilus sp. URMC 61 TaxID=3423411 RepID=UPI00406C63E8